MHDGGEVILKYHHLNQMFYVLSKTISIPSTFLVWLNKPGVSRIVISRTPIFHFSRPLSILHAAIKQKSSNHTESPLPFTPTPPTSPPHPKKRCQFIVQLSNSHHGFRITKALKWLRCDTVLPRLRANVPCNTSLRERVVNSLLLKLPPGGKNCAKWEAGCFFFVGTTARKSTQSILFVVFLLFVE